MEEQSTVKKALTEVKYIPFHIYRGFKIEVRHGEGLIPIVLSEYFGGLFLTAIIHEPKVAYAIPAALNLLYLWGISKTTRRIRTKRK